jgi:hypothetical protein
MRVPEGGEIAVNNVLCLTPVGTVGLSRTGNLLQLLRLWKNPDSMSLPGTGNPLPAGNRTKTVAPITNIETSVTNNDRATAALVTLVTSIITIAVIDRGSTRARSGKTRTSSGGTGSSRMTRTPTSS